MLSKFSPLSCLLLAALIASPAVVHAQSKAPAQTHNSTIVPVWNNTNGKLEAYLLIEPSQESQLKSRWRFGQNTIDAGFGLSGGDSLALVCNRKSGVFSALGNLANNCQVASIDENDSINESRNQSFGLSMQRSNTQAGMSVNKGRDTLPAWMSNTRTTSAQIDVNDLTIFAKKNIGREGIIEIAGTLAKARLVSPAEASNFGISDQWSSKSLSIGGGYGSFKANIIGHVVDTPNQPEKWEGLGLGLTWKTPWSAQLTVGADNIVTRGKNPFAPVDKNQDEGTMPYVRYEQEL